jgi:acyl carrier protein phosphodiesterase
LNVLEFKFQVNNLVTQKVSPIVLIFFQFFLSKNTWHDMCDMTSSQFLDHKFPDVKTGQTFQAQISALDTTGTWMH